MSKYIHPGMWDLYNNIVTTFLNEDAGLQPFIWLRKSIVPGVFGEDSNTIYYPVELKGLFQYNYIKSWPSGDDTPTGVVDTTSVSLFVTKDKLQELGYITDKGSWDYDRVSDRFILDGRSYRPAGGTAMSQLDDHSMLFFIVLSADDEAESNELVKKYLP